MCFPMFLDMFSNFLQNICANNVRVEPSSSAVSMNDQNALPKATALISEFKHIRYAKQIE